MNIAEAIVSRGRLFVTVALLLTLVGALSWLTMPRQEDPALPARASLVVVPWPGADAERVERMVVEPLEERLSQIDEIKHIWITARTGVAVGTIELLDEVSDVEPVWDEVERKLRLAEADFPDGVLDTYYDRDLFDQESIVVALSGVGDPLALADAAEALRDELLALPTVARIVISGDPGEQVRVTLDEAAASRLGIDARTLAGVLASRNSAIPGGSIEVGGRVVTLQPHAEFADIDEIRAAPIPLPGGDIVRLDEIAEVVRAAAEPTPDLARVDGERAVTVGIVPRTGINLLAFGDEVDATVQAFMAEHDDMHATWVAFQPRRVAERLESLGRSLLTGVFIVALVLLLSMGPRLGLTVATIVPVVAMSALAIYATGGGVLHQMSIAALVLALGLLVDNAIVVAENVQARLDRGDGARDAAVGAVRELAIPLGSATGTTLAAFVPMLLSKGPTGDFTRALPIVIMLTLVVSYVFAVTVTPVIASKVLRPAPPREGAARPGVASVMARAANRHPWMILLGVSVLLAMAGSMAGRVGTQFFPLSDRNQVVVDIELPEGAHLSQTSVAAQQIERMLEQRDDVTAVAAFVGRGVPHFYYNLIQKPNRPHLSQIIVTTRSVDDVDAVIRATRAFGREHLPGAQVVARRIEQGPPVEAPVEFRLLGDDLDDLRVAAEQVTAILRQSPDAVDVRHTLGTGTASLHYHVDDAAALRHGLSRDDVAISLLTATYGIEVGQYRAGDDPAPIVVRSPEGEDTSPDALTSLQVGRPGVPPVPLAQLATEEAGWGPAAIARRDGQRMVRVLAQLDGDAAFSDVLRAITPQLGALELPPGVTLEVGGEAEGSGDANAALLTTLPLGIVLLLVFLMGEFNSFRRVGIVLTTVPLAAVGVVPGLVIGGQPFGFMSMLGVIALIGIVVNNAIVLLDVVVRETDAGAPIAHAIEAAISERLRPILLTTATTVAGMLPLALSGSTMWPPLASAMISGLLASTMLTLLVVPALVRVMFRDRTDRTDRAAEAV